MRVGLPFLLPSAMNGRTLPVVCLQNLKARLQNKLILLGVRSGSGGQYACTDEKRE
jgi:hypothetical protein